MFFTTLAPRTGSLTVRPPTPTKPAPAQPPVDYRTDASVGSAAPGVCRAGKAAAFAVTRAADSKAPPINPFAGTTRVTLPTGTFAGAGLVGLDIFAADANRITRFYDAATDRAIYLVGRAAHPTLSGDAFLKWCGDAAATEGATGFRDVLNAFVVLIDDRRARRVSFVSDALGLLPWFVGRAGGKLVAGTDALGICDAGLSTGEVDYDSVASWLCYNLISTGGSVVRDYRRVAYGAVSTFKADGTPLAQTNYARLTYVRNVVSPEELIDGLFERAHHAFTTLTRDLESVNLPLSGGYDSRLLAAMAAAKPGLRFNLTCVETVPEEAVMARRVADALDHPLHVIACPPSKIDLFDDPLYFLPEGFPKPRNLTNAIARMRPGVPVLSGYLGDGIMRGPLTKAAGEYLKLDDEQHGDEFLARGSHERCFALTNRLHLLRDRIAGRATARATATFVDAIRTGRVAGRPIAHTNLYIRQRLYFSCIFLSHLDVADVLLPFPAWDLVNFNATHVGSFAFDTYDRIFRKYFPHVAGIPQAYLYGLTRKSSSAKSMLTAPRTSRHLRRWCAELIRGVPGKIGRTAITPHKLLKRLPSALMLDNRHADEIGYVHRVHAFEQRLAEANVNIDWSKI